MKAHWSIERERVSHADDWLMTYADVITLLLCFFAVFLPFSMPRPVAPQTAVRAPVAVPAPLPPADILEGNLPLHGVDHANQPTDDQPTVTQAKVDTPPRRVDVASTEPVIPHPEAPKPVMAAQTPPTPMREAPKKPEPTPQAPAGDRITIIEMSSAAFFDSGSATLSKSGETILADVAAKLTSDPYKDYEITVEGHTDDTPIATPQFPSNWELSTARASAVVHYFIDQGIPPRRLRAAGYADTFPKVPNRDAAGNPIPANQAQNRRVVIKLEKIEKAEPVTGR